MSSAGRGWWLPVWGGACVAGLVVFVVFAFVAMSSMGDMAVVITAFILAGIIAAVAGLAYARGRREFAIGVVAGYGILSLLSGGACTITFGGDPSRIVSGLFGYVLFLIVLLVAVGIVAGLRKRGSP